ncbi:MAG: hypothetical protein PUE80_03345, partial [bacterium]|nr:hypothetical protein [bacterium]
GVTAKDNGGACFPLDFDIMPTIGRQPSHPHRSGFFYSFHATYVPTYRIWGFMGGREGGGRVNDCITFFYKNVDAKI